MTDLLSSSSLQALALALVHFVWQGAVIGLIALAIWRFARVSSSTKYAIGVGLMAAMLAAPVATFIYVARSTPAGSTNAAGAATASPLATSPEKIAHPQPSTSAADQQAVAQNALPRTSIMLSIVLAIWFAGVSAFSLRLLSGWVVIRRLTRRSLRPVNADIHALARRVAGRLALERIVAVFESSAVSVPVMVGWMKPAVLLPAAALTGLTTVQLEALIAHELAHVRRHDYLVNLLQGVVETLLFYHPAVWWLSRQVRDERERCCDDLAIGVCDRLVYATALADLASMTTRPAFALAATDGSLINRVRRILGQSESASASPWLPASFVGLIAAAIVPIAFLSAQSPAVTQVASTARTTTQPATVPQTSIIQGVVTTTVTSVTPAVVVPAETVVSPEPVTTSDDIATTVIQPRDLASTQILRRGEEVPLKEFIEKIRAALQDLRANTVTAQDRNDQATLEELRKRIADLEAKLAELLAAERRGRDELSAKRLFADEALKKAQAQELERARVLSEKGLMTQNQLREIEMARHREELQQKLIESHADRAKEAHEAEMKMRELTTQAMNEKLIRARELSEKGLLAKDELRRAEAELKGRVLMDNLSEDARKLLEKATDEKSSDADVVNALKNVSQLKEDGDRAGVLINIARSRPFTAAMVTAYMSAAESIHSEYDRARVFAQPIKLKAGR